MISPFFRLGTNPAGGRKGKPKNPETKIQCLSGSAPQKTHAADFIAFAKQFTFGIGFGREKEVGSTQHTANSWPLTWRTPPNLLLWIVLFFSV